MSPFISTSDQNIFLESTKEKKQRKIIANDLVKEGLHLKLYEKLKQQGDPGWRILRYEHIVDTSKHPFPVKRNCYVTPSTFAIHMQILAEKFKVVPLAELLSILQSDPTKATDLVAVTIDCGWKDLYEQAFAIIQRNNIPVTAVLPTAFIGANNIFWQDKVLAGMDLIRSRGGKFPPFSALPDNFFPMIEKELGSRDITISSSSFLVDVMENLIPTERLKILIQIGHLVDHLGGLPNYDLFLSLEDIKRLSLDSRISFASLTHRHNILAELPKEELSEDISLSFEALAGLNLVEKTIAAPRGELDLQSAVELKKLGISSILLEDRQQLSEIPEATLIPSQIMRTTMFEAASHDSAMFQCRLLGLTVGEVSF